MKTAAGLDLGSLQRSMVLSSLRAPASGVYLIQEVCDLGEPVNVTLLHRAWEIVAQRHPPLRCAIGFNGANPAWLRVCDRCDVEWREIGGERVETYLDEDRVRGFDFDRGIPMRFAVTGSTIVWTSHHALLDGRSYVNVWREWLAAYDAVSRGEEFLAAQSADFAGIASHPDPTAAERYWRDCFAGISETTGYIVDRLRPSVADEERFARESASLSSAATVQIHHFAGKCGVSVNHIVKGAWALLLSRYSGRSEIVFGVTRAGRRASEDAARGIGFFINTVPFRVGVTGIDVRSYLNEIRVRTSALRAFENTPVENIIEWSELPAGVPPFESVLAYERKTPQEALREAADRWRNLTLRRVQRSDAPITLAAFGSPELSIDLVFDTRLFGREMMRAAALHLRSIIESFAAHPDARLHEINMVDEDERRTFRARNESCIKPFSTELCAHQLFEKQARLKPQAIAIDSGDSSITYENLNRRANRIAWHLRASGAGAEDLVGIVLRASVEAIAAVFGALKAGCAFLPLDPDLPPERLKEMIEHARPKLVLRDASTDANYPEDNLPNVAKPSNAAYVIYTSGSSGKPKAVVMPHRALVNHSLAAADAFGIDENDRRLQFASIGTDVFVAEVFNYLSRGASLILGWNRNGSVREFLRFIDERRVTITGIPSAWWNEWVAALETSIRPSSLRAVIIGMEKASAGSLRIWKKVVQGRIRLFNAYGPTETSPTATVYEEGFSVWEESSVPIGKPLANTRVYVLDDHLNPVPDGIEGQLYIGGIGLSRGYLNMPEETSGRFVADPFSEDTEDRLYATGDIVFCLPDGNLVFSRRADRQVKIRGFRVELDEIEARLQEHSSIAQCAVVLCEIATLAAYYTLRAAGAPTPMELHSFLSKTLPEHMIPAAFIQLRELPMTTGGKIDRRELAGRDLPPLTAINRTLPLTLAEKHLAALWEEVLQVTQVFAADNFFELGGDSLQATRLITLIEEHFGVELPMAALWRTPTLSRMAAMIDASSEPDVDPVVCLEKNGSRIPFFCFPGADENPYYLWHLARHLGPAQPFYALRDPRPMEKRGVYTVEEAAARLIPFLQSVQPTGPYIVGGHCYGGIVAFEVARQLLDRGEKVALVVLLEVPAPGYPKIVQRWPQYLRASFELMRKPRKMVVEAVAHADLLKKLIRRKAIMARRRGYIAAGLKSAVEPLEKFAHPNTMAGLSYALRSVNCDVVQFIARDERHSTRVLDDPRLAWEGHVRGRFSVVETPGEAGVFFRPPHASELAARLANTLDLAKSYNWYRV